MRRNKIIRAICLASVICLLPGPVLGQTGSLAKLAREAVEAIVQKGGKEAAEDLARFGGEKAVAEVLEKAAAEGGEAVARKLAAYGTEHGAAVLKAAQAAPAKFVVAFDAASPAVRAGAAAAIRREPALMSELVAAFGRDALEVAAKHQGVGPQLLQRLGQESVPVLKEVTTEQAIQLSRIANGLAQAPSAQRVEVLAMIRRAPAKVLGLLERNPKVLATSAALGAFIAAKDEILGDHEVVIGPDGKPVLIEKRGMVERMAREFRQPISTVLLVVGGLLAAWAGVKLWAAWRISRARISAAERISDKES